MSFIARTLYPRMASKCCLFATTRVNWFSSIPSISVIDLKEHNEVFESQNQFAWKVDYFKKHEKTKENG